MADGAITLLDDQSVTNIKFNGKIHIVRLAGENFAVFFRLHGVDEFIVFMTFNCDVDGNISLIDTQAIEFNYDINTTGAFFKVGDGMYAFLIDLKTLGVTYAVKRGLICTIGIDDDGNIDEAITDYKIISYTSVENSTFLWFKNVAQVGNTQYFAMPYLHYDYDPVSGNYNRYYRITTVHIDTDGSISDPADDKPIYEDWNSTFITAWGSICKCSGEVYLVCLENAMRTMQISESDGSITGIDHDDSLHSQDDVFAAHAIGNFYFLVTGSALVGGSGIIYVAEIAEDGTLPDAMTDSVAYLPGSQGFNNWAFRTNLFDDEAWCVASARGGGTDGYVRAFTIDSDGNVSALDAAKRWTLSSVSNTEIIMFDQVGRTPYYLVGGAYNSGVNNAAELQSFSIDQRISDDYVSFIWVEGTKLHYIDTDGDERAEEGSTTGDTGDAGYLWTEGDRLHYIDENGDERYIEGTDTAANGVAGYIYIAGTYCYYVSENGDVRRFQGSIVP